MAYKKSFALAMRIFEISKTFPREERYSLTDQIRRSSRSVSANIAESYAKRLYPKYFINKLTDNDAENLETQVWVEYAMECQNINNEIFEELIGESREIGKLIYFMINNPDKFGSK